MEIFLIGAFTFVGIWVFSELKKVRAELYRLQQITRVHTKAIYGGKDNHGEKR